MSRASGAAVTLEVLRTKFDDALVIKVPSLGDDRGFFKETYVRDKYADIGITDYFVQDNVSLSRRGVLRGLHADPHMSKLVQVLHGEAFDVIVDMRRDSSTFGHWQGIYLRADDHLQLYVPRGFLHGFLALTEDVIFCYKQNARYAPEREIGVRWDDPDLAITWPLRRAVLKISEKDEANRRFRDICGTCTTRSRPW